MCGGLWDAAERHPYRMRWLYLADNLAALAVRGRIVVLAAMGGGEAPLLFGLLMSKRARLIGSVRRARPLEE